MARASFLNTFIQGVIIVQTRDVRLVEGARITRVLPNDLLMQECRFLY